MQVQKIFLDLNSTYRVLTDNDFTQPVPSNSNSTLPTSKKLEELTKNYQDVPFHRIKEQETTIQRKFNVDQFDYLFEVAPEDVRKETCLKIRKVVLEDFLKFGMIGGCIGIGAGFAGSCATGGAAAPLVLGGGTVGFAVGGTLAALLSYKEELITITKSEHYKLWKEGLKKESYTLYFNGIQRYVEVHNLRDMFCPLSKDFPLIPVKAPNEIVYDKDKIELYLEDYWSGKINWGLQCRPFKKEDLTYAFEFASNAIEKFRKVIESIRIDKRRDRLYCKGLEAIIETYIENHHEVEEEMLCQFSHELAAWGVPREQERLYRGILKKAINDLAKIGLAS